MVPWKRKIIGCIQGSHGNGHPGRRAEKGNLCIHAIYLFNDMLYIHLLACMLQSVVCQQRGAEMALNSFCKHFGEKLFTALPHLWLQISQSLENLPEDEEGITSIFLLCTYYAHVSSAYFSSQIPPVRLSLLPNLSSTLFRY